MVWHALELANFLNVSGKLETKYETFGLCCFVSVDESFGESFVIPNQPKSAPEWAKTQLKWLMIQEEGFSG